MLTKSMFMKMKHEIKWSSSMSPSIQVLHQQINGGGGSQCVQTALMQGEGVGIQNYGKHADIILERSLNLMSKVFSI